MEDGTTASRRMSPPVVIVTCPGGGGHLWARINPKWMASKPGRSRPPHPREHFWCPDHQDEKKAHISKTLSESAKRTAREYAALPLPATRRCTNKSPKAHKPGAVLPSGKFYRMKRRRKDGTYSEVLDSVCKECKKEQNRVYLASIPKDKLRRQTRIRQQAWRDRRREAAARIKSESDKQLPLAPFRSWLEDYILNSGEDMRAIALRADVHEDVVRHAKNQKGRQFIRMSAVDKIGVACGYPDLLWQLYPIDNQEEAA